MTVASKSDPITLGRSAALTSRIVERLFEVARALPDHAAVEQAKRTTTYGAFATMVSGLAARFAEAAEAPRVVICSEPSAETYAAMFAAMAAGGFYAPLNAGVGHSRLATAFEEIAPDVAVFSKETARVADEIGYAGPRVKVEDVEGLTGAAPPAREAHRLAYVMFTSGSTGKPKGVMIPQSALAHYAAWAREAMAVTPDDRWSQHPNIGFDLSVLDIYGALLAGATLFPLHGPVDRLFPARAIKRLKLTIWNSVPSVMGMMLGSGDFKPDSVASLRLLTFCGEPLLPEHVEGVFDALPGALVHNTYGPTEATVSCSLLPLTRDNFREHCGASVALGDEIAGTQFHIVDTDGSDAEAGELLISGVQLADGYWNDPEKTAKAFRTIERDGKRFTAYHTGDVVERRGDDLYFAERRDNQVKIKGFRIELGEISSQIRRLGYMRAEAIVEGQSIVALVEGEGDAAAEARIRAHLSRELESYMLPEKIAFIARFPSNANDKTDLAALKATWNMSAPPATGG